MKFLNEIKNIYKRREFVIIIFILLVSLISGLKNPTFFSPNNWIDLGKANSILLIVALGQMIVITTGGIDLSVSSVVALSGMVVAMIMAKNNQIPLIVLALIGMAVGLFCGFINGLIIGKGKVPPLITTLGTLAIYRGMAVVISKSQWVTSNQMTDSFRKIARGATLGINNLIFLAIIFSIIFFYFMGYTRIGREMYAYGGNKEAAKFAGISSERTNYIAFSISGAIAGIAGLLWVSRFDLALPLAAKGFELLTIAACVVGGASVFGGIGTVLGTVLGAILLGVILNALELVGVGDLYKNGIYGFVILLAVLFDAVILKRVSENLRRNRRLSKKVKNN